jgi:hypothetical protein
MEIEFVHHEPKRVYDKVCRVGNMLFLAGEGSGDPETQEVKGKDVSAGISQMTTFRHPAVLV